MEKFDVLIVGAGPAGVCAAKTAAKGGAKTILLEKQPTIMALKACGEATSQKTFETAGVKIKSNIVMHNPLELFHSLYRILPNLDIQDYNSLKHIVQLEWILIFL